MERLTMKTPYGYESINPVDVCVNEYSEINFKGLVDSLGAYEDAEEQGLLLRLDFKDELIEVLARKLLNEQFGACYMCKNPMKNITLDGVNNGCDGSCNLSEEHTVDDFLKKIVVELDYRKRKEAEQALKQMGE